MAIPTMPHDYVENWTNDLTGEGHKVYEKISTYTVDWYKYFTGQAFGQGNNPEYNYRDILYVLDKAPIDTKAGSGVEARSYWKGFTYADNISGEELRAIFYSYRQKKSYHRLNDGSFIDLTDDMFHKRLLVFLLNTVIIAKNMVD